jgi:hypothetical protein
MDNDFFPLNPFPGLARSTDPETSHEAAHSIDTNAMESVVYDVIRMFPNGCIGDDVVRMLPQYGIQTISPRYAPLIRQARSGRSQRVMKAATKNENDQQRLLP